MSLPRDAFLTLVRQAVAVGNRAGQALAIEARGSVGYQGAGPDPAACFCEQLMATGGHAYLAGNPEAAVTQVLDIVRRSGARRVLLGRGSFVNTLALDNQLRIAGLEVLCVDELATETSREAFFAADIGISGVDYLIAETGTVALRAQPGEPRSLSLLPPVYIAVADRTQLVADLFDFFEQTGNGRAPNLPSCLSLITGPSKTGDIELKLVTGVHGPGEVHVVLVTG